MDFGGKTALVTGGGSGIGAATAVLLAQLGCNVLVLGPDRAPLEEVAAACGAVPLVGDAAEAGDVEAAVREAESRFGGLDGLAACAGGGGGGRLEEIGEEAWRQAMRITLDTARVSARVCLPALAARKGAIVLVSSVAALASPASAAAYSTAKAALLGLARSIAHDHGPDVRINTLCPGLTRTAMSDRLMGGLGEAMGVPLDAAYAHATRWFPLRRAAEPVEIARAIAFLLSDWSSYMTGAVVVADGGASAIGPAI